MTSPCDPAPTVPGVTEGRSLTGTVAPSSGTLRAALLLVHAADAQPDDPAAVAHATFDGAAAWFRAVSYGRLDFRVEPTPRSLALPAASAVYATNPERYLRDSVAAADPYVDFSQVDVVYLSPAKGTPVASPTSAILNSLGVRADGSAIGLWIPFGPGFAADAGEPALSSTKRATCSARPISTWLSRPRGSTAGTSWPRAGLRSSSRGTAGSSAGSTRVRSCASQVAGDAR